MYKSNRVEHDSAARELTIQYAFENVVPQEESSGKEKTVNQTETPPSEEGELVLVHEELV